MFGKDGLSTKESTDLDTVRNDFEKGNTDVFPITLKLIPKLKSLKLRIGGNDGWCYDWVNVRYVLQLEQLSLIYYVCYSY